MPVLPPRTPKTLDVWEELDYVQRRRLFRLSWRWAKGLGLVLPLLALGGAWLLGWETVYQAGPLSPAHAMFSGNCRTCHVESFQTLHRFFKPEVRSVSDQACSTCHAGPIHHASQAHTASCVVCHREHRGHALLARVEDSQCLSCHRDLKHGSEPHVTPMYRDVASWAAHPPFAARWEGAPQDPGTLRFNHQKHLAPRGVPVLDREQLTKLWAEAKQVPDATWKVLQCADCHQPDEAGRFMKPIRYEQHCKECHPLSVQVVANLKPAQTQLAWREFSKAPAPHVEPEAVRAALRDRLTEFVRKHGDDFLGSAGAPAPRAIPGSQPASAISREAFAWVNQQLPAVEHLLFENAGGCRYCHAPKEPAARREPGTLPEFAHSQINTRQFPPRNSRAATGFASAQWFPHSRFHHVSHRRLDCRECHKAETSSLTSDVLMPTITNCRTCHDTRADAARADCVTCHTYHPADAKHAFRGTLMFSRSQVREE